MTPHDTYQEQLLDLAYGELGKREARALRAHLEGCPGCRAELARMTATRSTMSALPEEPAPDRGEAILLAAAREAASDRRPRPFLPSWVWSVSVGAVGLAAVALLTVRLGGTATNRVAQPQGGELVSKVAQAEDAKPVAPAVEAAPAPRLEPAPPPAPSRKRKAPAGAAQDELALGRGGRPEKRSLDARPDGASTSGAAGLADGTEAAGPGESSSQPEVAGSAAPSAPPPPAPRAEFARPPPAAAQLEEERDRFASAEKKEQAGQRGRTAGAKVRAAPAAAEDAMARYEHLRAAGRLHTATVSFSDCPGETSRRVEQDDQERVVKVTRRGALHGTPFEAEQFYRQDGALGAVRYRAAGAVQELRLGAAGAASTVPGIPASVLAPQHAAEAGLDAPPRCGE